MERLQVPLYFAALAAGAAVGLTTPAVAAPSGAAVIPILAALLYATFLGVPFSRIGQAARDWKFFLSVTVLNFVVVPVVVFALTRFVAHDTALLVGVALVLLAPCVDYVIVFTGIAGGAADRLLAAAPLLMLLQMVLLPLYLWWFVGAEFMSFFELAPFGEAFLLVIFLPMVGAGLTQAAARRYRIASAVMRWAAGAMVPLMMLTLGAVVASQIAGVERQLGALLQVVPIFVAFAAVMIAAGMVFSRSMGIDVAGARAVVFSGVTRNSLVVLPLALALPAAYALVPMVVVSQTLVELVIMVVCVRLVPVLVPVK